MNPFLIAAAVLIVTLCQMIPFGIWRTFKDVPLALSVWLLVNAALLTVVGVRVG